jgi:hypothetical protein
VVLALLAVLPGQIAKRRGHPSWQAIAICGFVGLFLFPCWIVAIIWAFTGTGKTERVQGMRMPGTGSMPTTFTPPKASADDWGDFPGTFEIRGVDRTTGLDTRLVLDADSPANAKAKAKLKGVVVTRVERLDA